MTIERYTTSYSFRIIDYASRGWHEDEHANWDLLDGVLGGVGDALPFVAATGTGDAAILVYSPVIGSYTTGLQLTYKAVGANTGAATINVNGLGAKSLKVNGSDPLAGFIPSGAFVKVVYDGTNFAVVTPAQTQPAYYISNGDSGAVTATDADDFYVENSGSAGISILTPAANIGSLNFASTLGTQRGAVKYDHATDALQFYQSGSKVADFKGGYLSFENKAYFHGRVVANSGAPYGTVFEAASPYRIKFASIYNPVTAYNAATYEYTVPATGVYEVIVAYTSDDIINGLARPTICLNGTAINAGFATSNSAMYGSTNVAIFEATLSDKIDIRGNSTIAGTTPAGVRGVEAIVTIKKIG